QVMSLSHRLINTYTHAHVHAYTITHTPFYFESFFHVHSHTHTHRHTQTHTHTHTHTHIHYTLYTIITSFYVMVLQKRGVWPKIGRAHVCTPVTLASRMP